MLKVKKKWSILAMIVIGAVLIASCTQDGETIYQADPKDKGSTAPLVVVVYDPNALGDQGYNDLIYQGVEHAAERYGLRTMQLSPTTVEEGQQYLQLLVQGLAATQDTVRRLFIVAASSYDAYLRSHSNLLASSPKTDLLYFETETPLEGKGSTFFIKYYGAMYEAGAISPADAKSVLLVGANPLVKSVADAVQGFTDGFNASPVAINDNEDRKLSTAWLSDRVSGGFTIADTTALRLLVSQDWDLGHHLLVPICGGAMTNFRRIIEMFSLCNFVGIDSVAVSAYCNFSVVKHIDQAVYQCIEQWLSPGGMPKHQTFGLADGFTGVEVHPSTNSAKERFDTILNADLLQRIHEEAIRKEAAHE